MDVTLSFLPFPDDDKDMAGAVFDFLMFRVLKSVY